MRRSTWARMCAIWVSICTNRFCTWWLISPVSIVTWAWAPATSIVSLSPGDFSLCRASRDVVKIVLHGRAHQFHGERQQVLHMHAEIVTGAPWFREGWRGLQQKKPETCPVFRIAELLICRANLSKFLWRPFRWKLAHQLKI